MSSFFFFLKIDSFICNLPHLQHLDIIVGPIKIPKINQFKLDLITQKKSVASLTRILNCHSYRLIAQRAVVEIV